MKPTRSILVAVGGALCLTAAGCFGDPTVGASGKVTDATGKAIAGASVTFSPASRSEHSSVPIRGETGPSGSFEVMTVPGPKETFLLRIEKLGFEPYQMRISKGIPNLEIRLIGAEKPARQ